MKTSLRRVRLQPGELYVAREPAMLETILGSCVSATLWSPRLALGAMCHGILPRSPRGITAPDGFRYVDFSIRYLVDRFDELGVTRNEIQAKLFGGADVLPVSANGKRTVGYMNHQIAVDVLEQEALMLSASDLGGTRGRTIHFNSATGDVFVRRLARFNASKYDPSADRLMAEDEG